MKIFKIKNLFRFSRKKERVAIFIDGSNLYHSLEENCKRSDLNFEKFSEKLSNDKQLYRTYYYNAERDEDINPKAYAAHKTFLSTLNNKPKYEVRLGNSKQRGETTVEKGVDIMLATDMLKYAWDDRYDIGIIVSGDGDYTYAVKAIKELGKYVEVVAFSSNLSKQLADESDALTQLFPNYFSELWMNNKPRYNNGYKQRNTKYRRNYRKKK